MNKELTATAAPQPQAGTVYSIQVLRGVAAVLVMLFHYSRYLKPVVPGSDIGYSLFGGGYMGVDIFFIISGFIIVHSTARPEHARPLDFLIRRFFRVVPIAQVATLVYFAIIFTRPPLGLLFKSLCFLPSEDIDPPKFGYPVVPQEWTLSYELLFYGLFAAALVFTHRRRVVLCALAILGCVIGFQWALGGPISFRPNAVFLPSRRVDFAPAEVIGLAGNPIMLDFIAGMLLASAYRAKDAWLHSGARNAARAFGTMMIGVFAFCYLSPVRPGNGLLDKGLGALCLVAGSLLIELTLPGAKPPRRSKGIFAAFLWLGTISYTLYLVHQGISERLLRFLASLFFGVKVDGLPGFLSLILLSLALASGAHVFLERAFIWVGKRLTSPRGSHVRAAGLGA